MIGGMGSVGIRKDDSGEALSAVACLDAIRLRLVESIDTEPVDERAADAVRRADAAVAALGDVDLARRWTRPSCEHGSSGSKNCVDRSRLPWWPRLVRWIAATRSGRRGSSPRRPSSSTCASCPVPKHTAESRPPACTTALPDWAAAEADGRVGVAQCELMARIAANPRIESAVLERDAPALLDDAIEQSFDEFERRARTWEALADPDR